MTKVRTERLEETILERLADGEALNAICSDEAIPVAESTVRKWAQEEGFGARYMRARDIGYDCRAERAVEEAKTAADPQKGRLAFDAERWYLGKMKPQYADRTVVAGDPKAPLETRSTVTLEGAPDEVLRYLAGQNLANDQR